MKSIESIEEIEKVEIRENIINCLIKIMKDDDFKCDKCNGTMKVKDYYERKSPIFLFKNKQLFKITFIVPKYKCQNCNRTNTYYAGFVDDRKVNAENFLKLVEIL